jgi:hypothetical protein
MRTSTHARRGRRRIGTLLALAALLGGGCASLGFGGAGAGGVAPAEGPPRAREIDADGIHLRASGRAPGIRDQRLALTAARGRSRRELQALLQHGLDLLVRRYTLGARPTFGRDVGAQARVAQAPGWAGPMLERARVDTEGSLTDASGGAFSTLVLDARAALRAAASADGLPAPLVAELDALWGQTLSELREQPWWVLDRPTRQADPPALLGVGRGLDALEAEAFARRALEAGLDDFQGEVSVRSKGDRPGPPRLDWLRGAAVKAARLEAHVDKGGVTHVLVALPLAALQASIEARGLPTRDEADVKAAAAAVLAESASP